MDHSNKRLREVPVGCGTLCNASSSHKRPTIYANRDFPPGCGTRSDALSSRLPERSNNNPHIGHHLDAADSRAYGEGASFPSRQMQAVQRDPTPFEKVREVLRVYEQVFNQLMREKEAKHGGDLYQATARIDLKTRTELERTGKVVNSENRIGSVPGIIEVGEEFTYKTQLQVVGLHFKPMGGIDYMKIEGVLFATCVVSSHGYDYDDRFGTHVVEYMGEGSKMINQRKRHEDQKMVRGNLALTNSMRHRRPVRMVRGDKSLDGKGKKYIYCGLYLVEDYSTKLVENKSVYKFRLHRMPGQPELT